MTGMVDQEDARRVDKPGDVRQVGLGAGGGDRHGVVTLPGWVDKYWSDENYRGGQRGGRGGYQSR